MDKNKLKEYAELKLQEKALTEKIDALKPSITAMLIEAGMDKEHPVVLPDAGTFSYGSRRKWKYTQAVKNAKKTLEETMKYEEQTGIATYDENPYTIFKAEGEEDTEY